MANETQESQSDNTTEDRLKEQGQEIHLLQQEKMLLEEKVEEL